VDEKGFPLGSIKGWLYVRKCLGANKCFGLEMIIEAEEIGGGGINKKGRSAGGTPLPQTESVSSP